MRIVAVAFVLLLVLLAVYMLREQKQGPITSEVVHVQEMEGKSEPAPNQNVPVDNENVQPQISGESEPVADQTAFSEPDAPAMEEYVLPEEYTLC